MANTTNYNWETPDDTDLVKDGAAAIRTLGSAVDTTTKALNPETTLGDIAYRSSTSNTNTRLGIGSSGQVLTVAGGVPTWATSDDANAIQNAIVDAKGDIVAASAADTPARLAVGTDNQRLVAASGEATGLKYVSDTQNTVIDAEGDLLVGDAADALQRLAIGSNAQVLTVDTSVDGKIKWATPAGGGGMTSIASGSLSGSSLVLSSISGTYKDLQLILRDVFISADTGIQMTVNSITSYLNHRISTPTSDGATLQTYSDLEDVAIPVHYDTIKGTDNNNFLVVNFVDYANTVSNKIITSQFRYLNSGSVAAFNQTFGSSNSTAAITSITLALSTGTYSGGTYILYGVA